MAHSRSQRVAQPQGRQPVLEEVDRHELAEAIAAYQGRDRRFGGAVDHVVTGADPDA
ncbi:undecaprenyl diphosphate synthase family protein [Salsipaludibacter albus]|uniref:undecaprenyl diphosphate synthase family protein n=1 Tax=Salsipaludibacter albus TaxID=2849650 RepID=UPI001EE4B825|nr:undecaprenyl diphosphate synthase family protein [Salsipaludibacter albus]MBY5164511.1 undecaprenyl diphosphate synthase family protein [Salsipaludibacter albus]